MSRNAGERQQHKEPTSGAIGVHGTTGRRGRCWMWPQCRNTVWLYIWMGCCAECKVTFLQEFFLRTRSLSTLPPASVRTAQNAHGLKRHDTRATSATSEDDGRSEPFDGNEQTDCLLETTYESYTRSPRNGVCIALVVVVVVAVASRDRTHATRPRVNDRKGRRSPIACVAFACIHRTIVHLFHRCREIWYIYLVLCAGLS